MTAPRLVGRLRGATPTPFRSSRFHPRDLPEDLLREASRRLGIISLLAAVLWALGCALDHLAVWAVTHGDPRWLRPDMDDYVGLACIAASLALYVYSRGANRKPRTVLDLGLVYMIVMSAALGLIIHWGQQPAGTGPAPIMTWLGAFTLIFAAIVPTPPLKMLVAAFISVSMGPLGMLIARARGAWDYGPPIGILVEHYPDYLLVGVSVVIAGVVTRLGQEVTTARELGSYQLGELLGAGGMGQVYRATHRMLARPAAIKLIRPDMLGPAADDGAELAVRRFRREAEAAASLRSPHTVELYDFGVTEDQALYFVMELLEGLDLESLVRKTGPLPAGRVIFILRQVCKSLDEAHAAGLVHRDIKPANIHVGRLGLEYDFVKVLDFGLVKSLASPEGEQTLATEVGLTPGTPAYLAPEMARGDAFDGRADIYSLGCVAYFLLTGQLVFEATSGLHMISRHLVDRPIPPAERAGVAVPQALSDLVLRCLAKQPGDRPAGAAELDRDLQAIATEPWGQEQARQWWNSAPGAIS